MHETCDMHGMYICIVTGKLHRIYFAPVSTIDWCGYEDVEYISNTPADNRCLHRNAYPAIAITGRTDMACNFLPLWVALKFITILAL